MADRDRGIAVEQQHRDGLANDVAAPDHHRFGAGDGNPAAFQNFDDADGRTRHQAGTLGREIADVHGMKSVHVLLRRHREQHLLGVHLGRQRQLHQDAVDLIAPVQVLDQRQELLGGDVVGRRVLLTVDAKLLAAFHLVANVNFRRGMVARQHDRQTGAKSDRCQLLHLFADFALDLRRDSGAVENDGRHSILPLVKIYLIASSVEDCCEECAYLAEKSVLLFLLGNHRRRSLRVRFLGRRRRQHNRVKLQRLIVFQL